MVPWKGVLSQCPCKSGSGLSLRQVIGLAVMVGLWVLILWSWSILRQKGVAQMKGRTGKIVVVIVLGGALAFVLVAKRNKTTAADASAVRDVPASATMAAIPRLVDLGSKSCIPCKMMAPILDQLRTEQAGKLQVEFIDVHQDEAAAEQYGINVIPTQILYDAAGKELWRHEGFLSKEDILAKCRELGMVLADDEVADTLAAEEKFNG